MLLTEEQAKQVLCCGPLLIATAILAHGNSGADYLKAENRAGCCIASGCMAWRWAIDEPRDRHKKPSGEVEEYRYRAGFCGLAASPYRAFEEPEDDAAFGGTGG